MDFSSAEENYLKAIYKLSEKSEVVSTNAIAELLKTSPASVTDMLKKLDGKHAVNYIKYKGAQLSESGKKSALWLIRKHRLWEVFLVEKLNFKWDEVHEVAEQLEHIRSKRMIERLDEFLGYPTVDPHGDPIPDAEGKFHSQPAICLSNAALHVSLTVVAVKDSSQAFLKYLDKIEVGIGTEMQVIERIEFDESLELKLDNGRQLLVSHQVSENIMVIGNKS
ncbi:MAG: metal-dependent transcriptional regulator [Flammeovirgaceae bacterium]